MDTSNPYAAPNAPVADVGGVPSDAAIAALDVSKAWKQKFALIAKAGGPTLGGLRALDFGERMKINFNILAFVFGPFYFLAKGMWRPALALTAIVAAALIALDIVLNIAGIWQLDHSLVFGGAAVFATRANLDYYKKVVLGRKGWL